MLPFPFTSSNSNLALHSVANMVGSGSIRSLRPATRWNQQKASRFIETALLEIACGDIQLVTGRGAEPAGAKPASHYAIVADGYARLLAISRFFGNDVGEHGVDCSYPVSFKLKGLRALTQFEGCSYQDLAETESFAWLNNASIPIRYARSGDDAVGLTEYLQTVFYR